MEHITPAKLTWCSSSETFMNVSRGDLTPPKCRTVWILTFDHRLTFTKFNKRLVRTQLGQIGHDICTPAWEQNRLSRSNCVHVDASRKPISRRRPGVTLSPRERRSVRIHAVRATNGVKDRCFHPHGQLRRRALFILIRGLQEHVCHSHTAYAGSATGIMLNMRQVKEICNWELIICSVTYDNMHHAVFKPQDTCQC